jgi:nondiscriminating aspartyl-tRNA synthetase
MQRSLSADLVQLVGQQVRVRGWVHALRSLGKIHFLILRDRCGLSQIVIQDSAEFNKIKPLQVGSVVDVVGEVSENKQTNLLVEIINPQITVEVAIHDIPAIEYFKPEIPSELEFILDHRAIALRNRKIQAVFTIQAEMVHAFRCYMHDHVHAVEYFSPNILGASTEGGAEFFNVDYFGYTATLAQSSQLYKQVMVGVNERVFALMPFFRAEKSHTSRHLSEGKQFEFEMGFFDHWTEIMDIQEGVIKAMLAHIHTKCAKELEILDGVIITAPQNVAFPRITFAQAQEIYLQRTGIDERHEDDLSPAAEKELCQYALEQFGTEFVFITDWKTSKRPFYSYPNAENPELTNTFDLICAGTEITSGGQRRHTYTSMLDGITLKGMDAQHFEDYLSIFKYGMPPHGGFGMGLERLTMTLLKLKNIREASLFPSDPKRIAGNRIKANIFFGAENIRNEIIRLLKYNECDFKHVTHEKTTTSEESALIRNTKLEEGIKALILRGKQTKKNYQFNLPAHLKLDMKMVATIVNEKCEFESPEVINERFGLTIGGVPPFGNLINIETYFDERIQNNTNAAFNCGLLTESIVMSSADLIAIVEPKIASFALE